MALGAALAGLPSFRLLFKQLPPVNNVDGTLQSHLLLRLSRGGRTSDELLLAVGSTGLQDVASSSSEPAQPSSGERPNSGTGEEAEIQTQHLIAALDGEDAESRRTPPRPEPDDDSSDESIPDSPVI